MFAEDASGAFVPTSERGVVFLSSIPSNMRPNEVRLHLQQHGAIFRTKFTAFPKKERSSGRGIMPLQFKNGYVEFLKKEDAINCAALLNGNMVATKKRRKSHGQLWNMRFLEGFSMGDLAEEREEQTRNRKEMEHNIKERERDANELFRKMVMQKKRQDESSATGGVKERKTSPVPVTAAPKERSVEQERDAKTTAGRVAKPKRARDEPQRPLVRASKKGVALRPETSAPLTKKRRAES